MELKSVDICDYCYCQLLHENCGKSILITAKRSQSHLDNVCKKCEEELKKKKEDNKLRIEYDKRKTIPIGFFNSIAVNFDQYFKSIVKNNNQVFINIK